MQKVRGVIQTKRVNEFAASRVARREDLLEVTQRDSHFGCELREIGSRLCHGNPCACHRFSRPAFGVFRATRVRKTVATVNGALCLLHTSHTPLEGLLEKTQSVLTQACDKRV